MNSSPGRGLPGTRSSGIPTSTALTARDLVYVDDLVDFVERALERQTAPYEMAHVSAGRAITVNDIVRETIAASGRALAVVHDPRGPTIKTSFSLDNGYAARTFGWRPIVGFPEGIRRTIDWWRQNHRTN